MCTNTEMVDALSMEPCELLHCAICLENFDNDVHQPKLLPCHHSFCRKCLENLVSTRGQIQCPTCRERAAVMSPPPYGVSRLQTNFYIMQMKEYLHQDSKVKGCRKHDNGSLTLFCDTCEVLVCATCKQQDHKPESGHYVIDLETAKREQVQQLEVEIAEAQQTLLDYTMKAKIYDTELINLNTAKATADTNIDRAFDHYVHFINQRRQLLKEEVASVHKSKQNNMLQELELLKVVDASLTSLIDQVREAISNGAMSDMLAYKAKLSSKNREICEEQRSNKEIEANYIRFDSEESELDLLQVIHRLGLVTAEDHLPSKVKVTNMNAVACLFTNMTVLVSDWKGQALDHCPISVDIIDKYDDLIPCMVQYRSEGQYEVTFRPELSGLHKVQVKFLDQVIRGGSFAMEVHSNDPVAKIGSRDDDVQMEFPRSVAVDRLNSLYVVDTGNNRIQQYSKAGQYLSELTISNESEIYSSCGMALDEVEGTLICPEVCVQEADLSEASALLVYSMSGELLQRYVYRDIMRRALSVAVNGSSHMIIADYELNTVFVFDKAGRLLRKFGEKGSGPGNFNHPTFLCIGENDNIIVSDGDNHRIQVFDRVGKFLYQFGCYGIGKGQFNMPFGVAADYHGNILAVDGGNKRVQVFRNGGKFLAGIESLGDRLSAPRGIAVTSDGYALVADRDNHCVKKFKYLHCTTL